MFLAKIDDGEEVFETDLRSECSQRLSAGYAVSIKLNGSYVSGGYIFPFRRSELPSGFTTDDVVFIQLLEEPREGQPAQFRLHTFALGSVSYVYQRIHGEKHQGSEKIRRILEAEGQMKSGQSIDDGLLRQRLQERDPKFDKEKVKNRVMDKVRVTEQLHKLLRHFVPGMPIETDEQLAAAVAALPTDDCSDPTEGTHVNPREIGRGYLARLREGCTNEAG